MADKEEDGKTTLGPRGRSTAEALEAARKQLADLTHQLAEEQAAEIARREASKSPIERRVDLLEKRVLFLAEQTQRLGGHHYNLYKELE
jgi:hypothetical protein